MTKELFHPKGLYLLGKVYDYFYSGRKITVENDIAVKNLKKKKASCEILKLYYLLLFTYYKTTDFALFYAVAPAHCTFLMLYKNSKLLPASPFGNSFCISLIYI